MAVNKQVLEALLEQLSDVGTIEARKMFGGIGIFREGIMFAMLDSKAVFRLRVDETTKADFETKGMASLTSAKKKASMPYYEVPKDILDDKAALTDWCLKAFDVAKKHKKGS